jgi:hypothetical protein
MKSLFKSGSSTVAGFFLAAFSAHAGVMTIDFGSGVGVFTGWPGGAAGASGALSTNVPNPRLLDTGELRITGTGGAVDCVQSTTTTTLCANSGAYGLGIFGGTQNNRIDPTEALTLTLTAGGYTAKLVSFDIDGFNGTELGQYSINGGAQVGFSPSGVNTTTVTLAPSTAFTTVAWTVPNGNTGNFSLAAVTLDVTHVPEPATAALAGLALTALGFVVRRRTFYGPTSR